MQVSWNVSSVTIQLILLTCLVSLFVLCRGYTRCSVNANCIKLNGTKLWNNILLANCFMFALKKYYTST